MKSDKKDFLEIEILKERQKLRILEQEKLMRTDFRELTNMLTGKALMNRLQENLFGGSGLAFKLGYAVYSLISSQFRHKRKK